MNEKNNENKKYREISAHCNTANCSKALALHMLAMMVLLNGVLHQLMIRGLNFYAADRAFYISMRPSPSNHKSVKNSQFDGVSRSLSAGKRINAHPSIDQVRLLM